jgi:hypothetical protein
MTLRVHVGEVGVATSASSGEHTTDLQRESTYLWGLYRARSGSADIYSTLRRLAREPSWPTRLLVQTNRDADGLRRIDLAQPTARSIDVLGDVGTVGRRYGAAPIDDAGQFDFTIDAGRVRWSEGDAVDLAGAEVAPGLRWYLPAMSDAGAMGYVSRIFHVVGTVAGVEVEGFVGCDEVHLAPGRQNYVDDPFTAGHVSDAWCTWATAYEDGSVEAGHAAFGVDGFGFGLRSTDGVATTTTDVAGRVTSDERGCPTHIEFDVDGEAWEFVADPRGMPVEPLPGPVRQAEGWFRRVGETRRPIVWCATPEVPAP